MPFNLRILAPNVFIVTSKERLSVIFGHHPSCEYHKWPFSLFDLDSHILMYQFGCSTPNMSGYNVLFHLSTPAQFQGDTLHSLEVPFHRDVEYVECFWNNI